VLSYIYESSKKLITGRPVIFFFCLSALGLMSYYNIYFPPVYVIVVSCLVISFALSGNKFTFARKYGDFSYGIYIYAWPVQQIYAEIFNYDLNNFFLYCFASILTTVALSIWSWKFVEKPALNYVNSDKFKWNTNSS